MFSPSQISNVNLGMTAWEWTPSTVLPSVFISNLGGKARLPRWVLLSIWTTVWQEYMCWLLERARQFSQLCASNTTQLPMGAATGMARSGPLIWLCSDLGSRLRETQIPTGTRAMDCQILAATKRNLKQLDAKRYHLLRHLWNKLLWVQLYYEGHLEFIGVTDEQEALGPLIS